MPDRPARRPSALPDMPQPLLVGSPHLCASVFSVPRSFDPDSNLILIQGFGDQKLKKIDSQKYIFR
jgi:hypothetical protein